MLAKWLEYWAALAQAEEEFGIVPNGVSAAIRNVKVSDFEDVYKRQSIPRTGKRSNQ